MANVVVESSLSLQDYQGVRGSTRFLQSLADTTTIADLVTALQTLETTVDGVTGAAIIEGRLTVIPPLVDGLKGAVAGADLEKTMLVNFSQSGAPGRFGIDIPGINPAKLTGGKIVLTQTQIAALTALIEGNYVSAGLYALTAVRDAAITFRKRRRELNRVTTATP